MELTKKKILVTGGAGFIGSNLCQALLETANTVICLDNFATGKRENIAHLEDNKNFTLLEGDIRNLLDCEKAARGVDYVLHQAALGSVPRSLKDPITSNDVNVGGFLNMLVASRDAGVKRFVYAASSSTYGDSEAMPKVEAVIGKPLSPYAITKYVNELYADIFSKAYGLETIGLRYFNVFGRKQDPNGAYAAVIPKWTATMINNEELFINGDGETSRDFCFIENTVQMNILAATAPDDAKDQVYNVAVGDRTTLNDLFSAIKTALIKNDLDVQTEAIYREFREGDVRHSQADITKAKNSLGYQPQFVISEGIDKAMPWYVNLISQ